MLCLLLITRRKIRGIHRGNSVGDFKMVFFRSPSLLYRLQRRGLAHVKVVDVADNGGEQKLVYR
jgi:hypothetical protein